MGARGGEGTTRRSACASTTPSTTRNAFNVPLVRLHGEKMHKERRRQPRDALNSFKDRCDSRTLSLLTGTPYAERVGSREGPN